MNSKDGLDGNLIKQLSSGSDKLKHRTNHENQKSFINRSTMFFLANDIPNITPNDRAVEERVRFINYKLSFVNKPTKSDERQADPNVKLFFNIDKYKNALFYLMIDTYNNLSDNEKIIGGYIIEPKSILLETKEWIKDENAIFEETLNERFESTNNIEDYVETKKIINYFIKECKMNLSSVKIGRMLTSLIKVESRDMNIKNVKCRLGIREIFYNLN